MTTLASLRAEFVHNYEPSDVATVWWPRPHAQRKLGNRVGEPTELTLAHREL